MNHNIRPFSVTFLGAATALLLTLYLYQGIGSIAFMLGSCCCYAILGYYVGKIWLVYAWQISMVASLPSWLLLAWRLYSSHDAYNVSLDYSLFLWLPFISLFSTYIGTYRARWLAVRRKQKTVSRENQGSV